MIVFDSKLFFEVGKTIGFILISFLLFVALQYAVRWYLFGKYTFRTFNYFEFARKRFRRKSKKPPPDSQDIQVVPPNKKWRISNEVVSLIHSSVSSFWALYSCLMFPNLVSDMSNYTNPIPRALIIMSFGYMIHDLIDLLINERSLRIIELLFHHVVVITGFSVTLITGQFLGVVIFGLLMELNSIFLHCRSLMNLYGQPKNSTAFKFIALLNLATYLVFRIAICIYLIYWQLTNALNMIWYLAIITFLVILSLTITNTVLLYRVLTADGIIGKGRPPRAHASINNNLGSSIPDEAEEYAGDKEDDDDQLFSSSDYDDDDTDLEDGKLRQKKRSLDKIKVESVNTETLKTNDLVFSKEALKEGGNATETGNGTIVKPLILDDKNPIIVLEKEKAAKIIIQAVKPNNEKIIVIEEEEGLKKVIVVKGE